MTKERQGEIAFALLKKLAAREAGQIKIREFLTRMIAEAGEIGISAHEATLFAVAILTHEAQPSVVYDGTNERRKSDRRKH